MSETTAIPLQSFLQLLTSNNVSITRAMNIASKTYKQCNTPEQLGRLTNATLLGFGVTEKEDRDAVLNAVNKAGYRAQAVAKAKQEEAQKWKAAEAEANTQKSSRKRRSEAATTDDASKDVKAEPIIDAPKPKPKPLPRKRRKLDDTKLKNEFLPDKLWDVGDTLGSLEFDEIHDEKALNGQYTIVNRAPIMMAWSYIVAEQMGFARQEAFSIASVYTEMNAVTKGLSLGIYDKKSVQVMEASPHGTQPYVELMGRRVPLFKTSEDSWRALDKEGKPASPAATFSYISRSLKQTAPAIVGALRVLAQSYTPEQINSVGWSLYTDFRPEADGWGKRGRVSCDVILGLRAAASAQETEQGTASSPENVVKYEASDTNMTPGTPSAEEEAADFDDLFDGEFTTEELSVLP
ncbi:hypothetical protein PENSPDRAFT_498970 [Peniophora sp. CONT]|nr:hypothetical protein PENSPDRAFT_498970 [Peniophora sp. CONT]